MNHTVSRIAPVGWASSLVLHAAAVAWLLQSATSECLRVPPATVTMSVVAPPRASPPVRNTAESEQAPAAAKAVAPSSAPKLANQTQRTKSPAVNAPVDLTGVTLTGGDSGGWASMIGNGQTMQAPILPTVAPSTPVAAGVPSGSAKGNPQPPQVQVVPAKDLANKPTPPILNASLLANYPAAAKQQGLPGNAKLLVRIDSDGVVRHCTVQSESSNDFGAACRRTLLGSRWSPPRDRQGNAVVTQVYYTCDFRVNGS